MDDGANVKCRVGEMSSLEGKVALVTGASAGIGAAVAARLAADGAAVAITGRDAATLAPVAESCGATPLVCDATVPADVRRAVAETVAAHGGLDVVVPNVGAHYGADVAATDDEAWQASLDVNLTSAFLLCREALPELTRRRGSIVIVASLAAHFAGPNLVGYTVAKHGLLGLVRSLARDYGPQGVRANAVCPGWTRTPLADGLMDMLAEREGTDRERAYLQVTADVPLRAPADPEQVAAVCSFLAGEDAAVVTGSFVMADGGASAVDLPTIAFDH